jgi:RNA polymerase sigma-70 factor (ECF subfamily)
MNLFYPALSPKDKTRIQTMGHAISLNRHPLTFSLQALGNHSSSRVNSLSLQNQTDTELVSLAQAGTKKAFGILISRWQNSIYTFCFRKLSHQEQAEELTQEIFIAAYRGITSFRNDAKFSTWLFQIATNRCKNLHGYRERRKYKHHEPLEGTHPEIKRDIPDTAPSADKQIQKKQHSKILQHAIDQLDSKYKETLILFDIQDIPQAEIAKILSLPIGTIKSRIHRARIELARTLKGKIDPKDIGDAK